MTTLRTLKKLLLGETWLLPIGLAITLAAGDVLHASATTDWPRLGGFILLAAVLLILLASVNRSARRRGLSTPAQPSAGDREPTRIYEP